jgi:UPF0755 protein
MNNSPASNTNSPRRSPWRVALPLALLIVAVGVLVLGWLLALQPVTLEGQPRTEIVTIAQGQGLRSIAATLEEKGLIRHAWAFRFQAYLARSAAGLKAGTFQLATDMSTAEMVAALASGKSSMRKTTFPEGLTLQACANLLAKAEVCSVPDLYGAASTDAVDKLLGTRLPASAGDAEGFLFPDTYFFATGDDPDRIVASMVGAFKQKFYDPDWVPASTQKPWGSLYQVVILASLVEKEAQADSERPLIAGVLLGRIRKGMRLQCDATVQYALLTHHERLTLADLKVPSPYNTYLHKGLPPGPICNPGLPSLQAALHPQATDYLFYVARPGQKTHVFTRTFEEHQAAIKALRGR